MAILTAYSQTAVFGISCILSITIPCIIITNLIYRWMSRASLPEHIPWAGVERNGGPFSRLRAYMTSFFNMKILLDEGYTKYSKHGQAYVLPHVLTGPEVVLPVSQARWLCEQPDHVMSQTEVNRQFLEADHTFLHPNIVREPVHPEVIRRELTHKLSSFADDIVDELQQCLEENWGLDTENWKEVKVYHTLLDVISRLSTRVFVGQPLCKNKEFLHSARMFDKNVVVSAAALNLLPGFLKPMLAPFLTIYDHFQYLTLAKFAMPLVKERLGQLQPTEEKLPYFDKKKPNDYIQWAIDHALAHWDPRELTATVITRRLACLCFAAIQSSVISITNALFDIASSPHCARYLDAMRHEVAAEVASYNSTAPSSRVQSKLNSPWGKAALARMVHVDSALRESMRLNGFVARGIMKTVTAPGGVTLPDGSHIPKGTKVGIQAYSVHRDSDYYSNAETYEAFRFVKGSATGTFDDGNSIPQQSPATAVDYRRASTASGSDSEHSVPSSPVNRKASTGSVIAVTMAREKTPEDKDTSGSRQPQALVTTSPTFLAFSHGPNACPGRFFAANQMKLTLAHIALYYEIEPVEKRPENRWFVGSMAPPMWETLRVRRRKE